jgi:thioredoxin 1
VSLYVEQSERNTMNKNVITGTDANFKTEVLNSDIPVLVDFWAPWCGPCRLVGPVVEELSAEYEGKFKVVKLNTDENPDTASAYGIMSIPTLAIFRNGKAVDGLVGAAPKKMLATLMDKYLSVPLEQ